MIRNRRLIEHLSLADAEDDEHAAHSSGAMEVVETVCRFTSWTFMTHYRYLHIVSTSSIAKYRDSIN